VETTICFDVDVGDHITMQLMERKKGSMKAEPVVQEKIGYDWLRIFSKLIPVNGLEVNVLQYKID
jgi:hypothetical protein